MIMSIVGQNVAEVYTAAELATQGKGFGLGDRYTDNLGNEFVYVTAGGTIAAGDVVQFTAAFSAAALTTAASPRGRRVGVAMAAMTSGQFGWVQVYGVCAAANVLTLAAADTRLNTTTTAGTLDDDGTTGAKQIEGIYLSTARGAGTGPAPCTLNFPFVSVTI
jgi:hypothetical protein